MSPEDYHLLKRGEDQVRIFKTLNTRRLTEFDETFDETFDFLAIFQLSLRPWIIGIQKTLENLENEKKYKEMIEKEKIMQEL